MLNKELKQGGSVQDILQITIYFFQTQTSGKFDQVYIKLGIISGKFDQVAIKLGIISENVDQVYIKLGIISGKLDQRYIELPYSGLL